VSARVFHISDLHIGRREAPEPISALHELAAELAPELLLVTGDLAHRGRRRQLEQAAELVRSFAIPFLAVPGNHDIPYTFPARFTRTFTEWERIFGSPEPVYRSERLAVVGLNSVRPWRQQGGAVERAQLDRAGLQLEASADGALRVVALHHHLGSPPWRAGRKRPIRRRQRVLDTLAASGAELVVSGHVHQAAIAERREFEVLEDARERSLVLATVPGLNRPRPQRSGEALGLNVYESDLERLIVETYAWDGRTFVQVGQRSFRRG